MFNTFASFNFSAVISFSYFVAYALSFIIFFYTTNPFTKYTTNLHAISLLLKYNKALYIIFVFNLIAFLGIPPFFLFAPKFTGLLSTWAFSNVLFFIIALATVFLSFSLYLQLFDLLFVTNETSLDVFNLVNKAANAEVSSLALVGRYNVFIILITLVFISAVGFILFKDFFVCLSLFI